MYPQYARLSLIISASFLLIVLPLTQQMQVLIQQIEQLVYFVAKALFPLVLLPRLLVQDFAVGLLGPIFPVLPFRQILARDHFQVVIPLHASVPFPALRTLFLIFLFRYSIYLRLGFPFQFVCQLLRLSVYLQDRLVRQPLLVQPVLQL